MSRLRVGLVVGACLLAIGIGVVAFWQVGQAPPVERDPLVEAGQRLFRDGILSSGEVATAVVLGDVPVTGGQVLCAACHGRSGMGTEETGTRTPSISGPFLFEADKRPDGVVYTEEALVRALREGRDPSGRALAPLMPRYPLSDQDAAALVAYLRQLGTHPSPGVDRENLHLATVIADDVPDATRKAMLDVLEAFVQDKNAEGRNDGARSRARREVGRVVEPYRVWSLDVWDVTGPPSGWRRQLERHYRNKPVFALVSGLAAAPWQPVHEFCQHHAIPCLLPNTERPPDPTGAFYTLYYSPGLRLEAQVMAADLAAADAQKDVLQLVDRGDEAAAEAAAGLEAMLREAGGASRIASIEEGPAGDAAIRQAVTGDASAAVLWTRQDMLARLPRDAADAPGPLLYLSATLLDGPWDAVPESLRARTRVVDLFRLPNQRDSGLQRFQIWARLRDVAVSDERLQAQTWFACLALLHGLDHTNKYLERDYLIDSLDHATGLTAFLPIYPRGSLGPGQRFLAKGGHVVDVSGTVAPRWVVP